MEFPKELYYTKGRERMRQYSCPHLSSDILYFHNRGARESVNTRPGVCPVGDTYLKFGKALESI